MCTHLVPASAMPCDQRGDPDASIWQRSMAKNKKATTELDTNHLKDSFGLHGLRDE